jgi:hypothetical protein
MQQVQEQLATKKVEQRTTKAPRQWITATFINSTTTPLTKLRRQIQGRQGGHEPPRLELQGFGRDPSQF